MTFVTRPHAMKALNALPFAVFLLSLQLAACGSAQEDVPENELSYRSELLTVRQLGPNSFMHTSFLRTDDFGTVPCNGLVVRNGMEAVVFDTPTNDSSAAELIRWVQDTLQCRIIAVVPTHFHDDCLGGLQAFHDRSIPSYASERTRELAQAAGYTVPQHGFTDSLQLRVGQEHVRVSFPGEGHTSDNVVAYFPAEQVLFGGCLIKELEAGKGYLGDANTTAWSGTVEAVKKAHPDVKVVVPGHGEPGDARLLDYTIRLFQQAP